MRSTGFHTTATLAASVVFVATALLSPSAALSRPDVLVLVSDDQRPDTIAALGNPHIRTPHLDRLLRRGAAFTRATCANPICTPSRAEILTGQSGFANGVRDFGRPIRPDAPRWARAMQAAGYRTCYVGKWHNRGRPADHGYERTRGLYAGGGGRWTVPSFDWNGRPVTGYRGWVFQSGDGKTKYPEKGVGLRPGTSERIADAAIEFLRSDGFKNSSGGARRGSPDAAETADRRSPQRPGRPFFLHVNFPAPHDPLLMPFGYEKTYDPAKLPVPENFLPRHPFDHGNFEGRDEKLFEWPRTRPMVRDELAVYYAVISHMDEQIGRILGVLEETGRLEKTLIVFSSDHGLAIGSHGLRGKQNMYEHTIGVPLIVAGPGVPRGRKFDAQCYLRDLFPTVCELCEVPVPAAVEGRSLKPVLDGRAKSVYPHVFGYFRDFQRMIRTDRYKLIHYPHLDRWQLFDLQNDPHELHNLAEAPQHAAALAGLRRRLRSWQRSVADPALTP